MQPPITRLILLCSMLAATVQPASSRNTPTPENRAPASAAAPDMEPKDMDSVFHGRKSYISDIRHWLTAEIISFQTQGHTPLLTYRFTNHSRHDLTILGNEDLDRVAEQEREKARAIPNAPVGPDVLFYPDFGNDSFWKDGIRYSLDEDLPTMTLPAHADTIVIRKLRTGYRPNDEDDEITTEAKTNGQGQVSAWWPLYGDFVNQGEIYPDAAFLTETIHRIALPSGKIILPLHNSLPAPLPPEYRRPLPCPPGIFIDPLPVETWKEERSSMNNSNTKDTENFLFLAPVNLLLLARDKESADRCARSMEIWLENEDMEDKIKSFRTDLQEDGYDGHGFLPYLQKRWEAMQQQKKAVIDELRKKDFYGSDRLRQISERMETIDAPFVEALKQKMRIPPHLPYIHEISPPSSPTKTLKNPATATAA